MKVSNKVYDILKKFKFILPVITIILIVISGCIENGTIAFAGGIGVAINSVLLYFINILKTNYYQDTDKAYNLSKLVYDEMTIVKQLSEAEGDTNE